MTDPTHDKDLQGEGNYEATRRYDKSARDFVESGRVDDAAAAAPPENAAEAADLKRAEEIGKSHSKGEDAKPMSPRTDKSQDADTAP